MSSTTRQGEGLTTLVTGTLGEHWAHSLGSAGLAVSALLYFSFHSYKCPGTARFMCL